MKLLHVDSSILGPNSVSRSLSAAIVEQQKALHPGLEVIYRDLAPRRRCIFPARIWPPGRARRPDDAVAADVAEGGGVARRAVRRRHHRDRRADV